MCPNKLALVFSDTFKIWSKWVFSVVGFWWRWLLWPSSSEKWFQFLETQGLLNFLSTLLPFLAFSWKYRNTKKFISSINSNKWQNFLPTMSLSSLISLKSIDSPQINNDLLKIWIQLLCLYLHNNFESSFWLLPQKNHLAIATKVEIKWWYKLFWVWILNNPLWAPKDVIVISLVHNLLINSLDSTNIYHWCFVYRPLCKLCRYVIY